MQPKQLWDKSAQAWIDLMEKGDLNRTLILDGAMLRLAGDVAGLRVCDIGCGEGRFCRMLASRGAHTVGLEPTVRLVEQAHGRHPEGSYVVGSGEHIPLAADSADLVICYLVLIDIPNYRAAIREMARVLKPGGRLLFANLNSFCTTRHEAWIRDEHGEQLYVAVDNYFEERAQLLSWSGITVVNYHRPFQAYMEAFLACGLRLTRFEEPVPLPEAVAETPEMADALRVPLFHVMEWRKD